MAAVYLAEDRKHHRKVAIKVLHPELAATLGSGRFLREIEIAAQLTHPHILPLLDSGEADGFLYYVMPYIEGQSLRQRLSREGELPVVEAVRILREVVDALAEAHSRGLVHRDIKPDNVLLRGHHAVVTDFGVAKAVSEATGRHALTTAGIALGTPAYMAPEQAAADPNVDHRADIYALGVLAYEMLTGRPPFDDPAPQAVLAAHVTQAPEPVTTRREMPPALGELVMRCLRKKPADRWQSAAEMLPVLEAVVTPTGGITPVDTRPIAAVNRGRRRYLLLGLPAAALLLALAAVWLPLRSPEAPLRLGRQRLVTNLPGLELDPAISPDGKMVAYAGGPLGRSRIYLRQFSGGQAIELTRGKPGDHRLPQWSPDGSQLLFLILGVGIELVPALGGATRPLVRDPDVSGAAWSPDGAGIVYFSGNTLFRRRLDQPESETLATTAAGPWGPAWSPDGRWIAYVAGNSEFLLGGPVSFGNISTASLWIVSAEGGEPIQFGPADAFNLSPTWTADSRGLLFVSAREGARDIYHVAVGRGGRPTDPPQRLTTGLDASTIHLSAGVLAYSVYRQRANVWALDLPRSPVSAARAVPLTRENAVIESIDVTPDGRWLAFDSDRSGNFEIYRQALAGGEPEQLTSHPAGDFEPMWSPDGRRLLFQSWRGGSRGIHYLDAESQRVETVLDEPVHENYPAWTASGDTIAFVYTAGTTWSRLALITRSGGGWSAPRELAQDVSTPLRWSPDGRWLAHRGPEGLRIIGPDGAGLRVVVRSPRVTWLAGWSPDGRVLFYSDADETDQQRIWSVPLAGGSPTLLVRFDDPTKHFTRGFVTDGRRLYFTQAERESDIWTVEATR